MDKKTAFSESEDKKASYYRQFGTLVDVVGLIWSQLQEQKQKKGCASQQIAHTLSIAFQHLPPNSARFSYTIGGALFISIQLSTDEVNVLWKVWLLIRL